MAVVFPNMTPPKAQTILDKIANHLATHPCNPDDMMPDIEGILLTDKITGRARPLCDYRQSMLVWYHVLAEAAAQLRTMVPSAIAEGMTDTLKKRIYRANECWAIASPVVPPGTVSAMVTLQISDTVNAFALLDIAVDPEDAKIFNLPFFSIGASQLVKQGLVLTPAQPLAGLPVAVWQCDGPDTNDVRPEFGTTYASERSGNLTISAQFAHKCAAGPLAYDKVCTIGLLVIAASKPRCNDVHAAEALEALNFCAV